MFVWVRLPFPLPNTMIMKELEQMKDGKMFTDDNGLFIYWQPVLDKTEDLEGKIRFRAKSGQPCIAFRVIQNKFDFEGEVKIKDKDGDFILNIEKDKDFIGMNDVKWN